MIRQDSITLLLGVTMVQDAATKDKIQLPWDFQIGNLEEEFYDEDLTWPQYALLQSQNGQVTEIINDLKFIS